MIVLDTHIRVNWILGSDAALSRLSLPPCNLKPLADYAFLDRAEFMENMLIEPWDSSKW